MIVSSCVCTNNIRRVDIIRNGSIAWIYDRAIAHDIVKSHPLDFEMYSAPRHRFRMARIYPRCSRG
jgi:hypothetical protein